MDLKPGKSTCLSFVNSSFVRMGDFSSISRACSGVGLSRFRSEPMAVSVDMMMSSRMQSIGGLVTWAKSCLK